jgi:mono/diheme cytochrome c family protein
MRKYAWLIGGVVAIVGSATIAAKTVESPSLQSRDLTALTGSVDQGAYVARLAGCIACHTDAKSGGAILAGGAEIATDFGSFYAPNITPHPEDGIGNWTLDDFARALREGLSPDNQHYFPSFPYTFYTRLTDQDIVDLWAAVRSVPPVANRPPEHELSFPFGFHEGVGIWKIMFFDPRQLEPVEGKSEAWNRGRYLARGPAHCGACHTPRNLLGGRETDQRYGGGVGPESEKIPPITPEALVADGWTRDDLVYALRTGIMPDGDVFGGSMVEVVRDSTRFWSDTDLAALVEYLMDSEAGG